MNKIGITATGTRNLRMSAFYVQHILDHTSRRTVYIQLGHTMSRNQFNSTILAGNTFTHKHSSTTKQFICKW